ncbi:hypothetical protein D3C87_2099750 [compost metagenome]
MVGLVVAAASRGVLSRVSGMARIGVGQVRAEFKQKVLGGRTNETAAGDQGRYAGSGFRFVGQSQVQ